MLNDSLRSRSTDEEFVAPCPGLEQSSRRATPDACRLASVELDVVEGGKATLCKSSSACLNFLSARQGLPHYRKLWRDKPRMPVHLIDVKPGPRSPGSKEAITGWAWCLNGSFSGRFGELSNSRQAQVKRGVDETRATQLVGILHT